MCLYNISYSAQGITLTADDNRDRNSLTHVHIITSTYMCVVMNT